MSSSTAKPWFKDWTHYLCPGPQRRFTPAEMARAAGQPWPAGIDQYIVVTSGLVVVLGVLFQWSAALWVLAAAYVAGVCALGLFAARQLWRSPTRLRLNVTTYLSACLLAALVIAPGLYEELNRSERLGIAMSLTMAYVAVQSALWFLTMYRVQQIEARLRELDDQAAQQRLMNRLATAQIHPHFVFNTLASLTQWVETGDARAAPLLREFAAYLRATLPMFEREQQPLRDELDLVRHYLADLAARLGERLQWQVDVDPSLEPLPVPPGSLLTLVENAITHGIEPALRGGTLRVGARRVGGQVVLEVLNSGCALDAEAGDGLGLSNTRQRLLALHPGGRLWLEAASEDNGCIARIELPYPSP